MVAQQPNPRHFYAVEYAIRGDLRFLSHQDELRMLGRAITRAGWPLSYSEGFNPQPRINIPLPRSVGVLSDAQLAVLTLDDALPPAELFDPLARAMPTGAPLTTVIGPLSGRRLHGTAVAYRVHLDEGDAALCHARAAALLRDPALTIERTYGPDKPTRTIDIRPYIEALEPLPDGLRMKLRLEQQQSARPEEILLALGCNAAAQNHRICRETVTWHPSLDDQATWPPRERNSIGQEGNHQEEDHA